MEGWEPLLFLFSRRQKQFSEWKMLYKSFLTRIIVTHLRSSDLTEYPDPDSPEPCLGSVYIWRPFIPPHRNPLLKIFDCTKYPSSGYKTVGGYFMSLSSERSHDKCWEWLMSSLVLLNVRTHLPTLQVRSHWGEYGAECCPGSPAQCWAWPASHPGTAAR